MMLTCSVSQPDSVTTQQFKAFWDATGGLWAQGALAGKQAGIFVSTSGQGGGQETTAVNALSVLVHHGIIFVPLGYAAFPLQNQLGRNPRWFSIRCRYFCWC